MVMLKVSNYCTLTFFQRPDVHFPGKLKKCFEFCRIELKSSEDACCARE